MLMIFVHSIEKEEVSVAEAILMPYKESMILSLSTSLPLSLALSLYLSLDVFSLFYGVASPTTTPLGFIFGWIV